MGRINAKYQLGNTADCKVYTIIPSMFNNAREPFVYNLYIQINNKIFNISCEKLQLNDSICRALYFHWAVVSDKLKWKVSTLVRWCGGGGLIRIDVMVSIHYTTL